ncbi:hypothetical protein KHF85_07270 [Xanthomonas translucens pv. graminis]|uniref:hypothetical protein n=1 Tax=Xanthomonas graminis TaxID=3390026 RepID=UPI00254046F5|nr:hypothetical protein [Xanthomonas translucens]WIH06220.1 hypothetical protein KHF85_07270 [Xanthomonas translucens pv. graminis]
MAQAQLDQHHSVGTHRNVRLRIAILADPHAPPSALTPCSLGARRLRLADAHKRAVCSIGVENAAAEARCKARHALARHSGSTLERP